ncbi:MAG: hypothetical protein WC791_03635 [Candidatus Paceibacterota bacterium]|jgi:hypothetical protein
MAKVKNPMTEANEIKTLVYSKRIIKNANDDYTHNVRVTGLKPKKKSKVPK